MGWRDSVGGHGGGSRQESWRHLGGRRSYPPSKTFGYLAALTASALLLLAAVLTVYLAAGVRVKAWSLRVNSFVFVTLLFII